MQTREQIRGQSRAEKVAAYKEAQRILQMGKKWQRLVPGEKRPDFERAARSVLQAALKRPLVQKHDHLDIRTNAIMHEQPTHEARLIDRYLRSGTVHPDVRHSFESGRTTRATRRRPPFRTQRNPRTDPDMPDVELYVQDLSEDLHLPAHLDVRRNEFTERVHTVPFAAPLVPKRQQTVPSRQEVEPE